LICFDQTQDHQQELICFDQTQDHQQELICFDQTQDHQISSSSNGTSQGLLVKHDEEEEGSNRYNNKVEKLDRRDNASQLVELQNSQQEKEEGDIAQQTNNNIVNDNIQNQDVKDDEGVRGEENSSDYLFKSKVLFANGKNLNSKKTFDLNNYQNKQQEDRQEESINKIQYKEKAGTTQYPHQELMAFPPRPLPSWIYNPFENQPPSLPSSSSTTQHPFSNMPYDPQAYSSNHIPNEVLRNGNRGDQYQHMNSETKNQNYRNPHITPPVPSSSSALPSNQHHFSSSYYTSGSNRGGGGGESDHGGFDMVKEDRMAEIQAQLQQQAQSIAMHQQQQYPLSHGYARNGHQLPQQQQQQQQHRQQQRQQQHLRTQQQQPYQQQWDLQQYRQLLQQAQQAQELQHAFLQAQQQRTAVEQEVAQQVASLASHPSVASSSSSSLDSSQPKLSHASHASQGQLSTNTSSSSPTS